MPVCPVDETGYCPVHKHRHVGRILELALHPSDGAEAYRKLWLERPEMLPDSGLPPPPPPKGEKVAAPPRPKEWPLWARAVALLRHPEDKGLGDTIARNLAKLGADAMVKLYVQATGGDCGCSRRHEILNQMFPYGTP